MLPFPDPYYYMPFGRPAFASVEFAGPPTAGDTLTINGVVYTFGTSWGGHFGTSGSLYVKTSSVRDLTEYINGADDTTRGTLTRSPHASVYAWSAGSTLVLYAREPGTAGNAFTLSTSNSSAFVVSGATFSGGTSTSGSSSASVTEVRSTALEASHVLKASAGSLKQLSVFNSKASAQFILLMDSATVPANGAVTLLFPPIPIAAASLVVLDFPVSLGATLGIAVANSSTGTFTKTLGSADCVFYAQVI